MQKIKPVLSVDFDGVLHAYSKGLHDWTVYDLPVPGAQEFIRKAQEHFFVIIFTARCRDTEGMKQVQDFLKLHEFPEGLIVTATKYPSFLWMDDRAITFHGNFPNPESMLNFRPWNRPHDQESTAPGWMDVIEMIKLENQ